MITQLQAIYDTSNSFYGKAILITNGDDIILKSYETDILTYNTKTKQLTFLTDNEKHFTLTTIRHINEFLKQFTPYPPKTKSELLKMARGQKK